jgi:hypothetical protein
MIGDRVEMYEMNKEKLSHVFTIYAGGVLDASYSY